MSVLAHGLGGSADLPVPFTYALIVLREVRNEGGLTGEFVPGLVATTAFGLVLVSLVLFVPYIPQIPDNT